MHHLIHQLFRTLFSLLILVSPFITCTDVHADTVIHGGTIYTMSEHQPNVDAIVVRGDQILFTGGLKAARAVAKNPTYIDLKGKTLTPGLIEAHGHLMGLGYSQLTLNLSEAKNYADIVAQVTEAVENAAPGEWILGRGWHQSKWLPQPEVMIDGFQTHDLVSAVSPDNPVFLVHASGHAAMANQRAMDIAGVDSESEFVGDGEIIKDAALRPTGIFNEVAQSLIAKHVPTPDLDRRRKALGLALDALGRNGITSFQDAGVRKQDIELYRSFLNVGSEKPNKLTARLWLMLAGGDEELLLDWFRSGPEIGSGDNFLTIRAIKLVIDGALGSRGAWLLEPYSDRPDHVGLPTMPIEDVTRISQRAFDTHFQIGVHAIGDRGNREVLNIYEQIFSGKNQGVRFRIEHAQHIAGSDIPRFGELGVIASMQGIHLSSDRPWAIDRLGSQRIEEGAYVWRKLLDSGAVIANGTDVPVEPVNPINSFFALVTRQTLNGEPAGGYEPSQKLTRQEALKSYTLDAAYAAFEEHLKGSIEPGKLADFTVFDQDIMTVADEKILDTNVAMTMVGGKVVFNAD